MSDETSVATADAPAFAGSGSAGGAVVATPQPLPTGSPAMDRILSMADHCLREHQFRQAAEMYFDMMGRQEASVAEAEHARRCLMQIAEYYERMGKPHQARGIYEQLL